MLSDLAPLLHCEFDDGSARDVACQVQSWDVGLVMLVQDWLHFYYFTREIVVEAALM